MDAFLVVLEYIGIFAFAVSGAMVAIDKEADYVGILLMSLVTCFAGGIMRDVLLGCTPPRFFTHYGAYILICIAASCGVIIFASVFKRLFIHYEGRITAVNNIVDAMGLGAFSVGGVIIALESGFDSPLIAISMGVISSVVGGLSRDLILRDIPFIVKKRIYVLASLLGASLYYVLAVCFSVDELVASIVGVLSTFVLRILSTVFKWNVPKAIHFDKLERQMAEERAEYLKSQEE